MGGNLDFGLISLILSFVQESQKSCIEKLLGE